MLYKYKTVYPKFVSYPDNNIVLYIDPKDWRGKKKIAFDFARKKIGRNIQFWRDLVTQNNPDLCLDIGANYGECLFSLSYNNETSIIGIEANTKLIPHLLQSKENHPNKKQIAIFNILAGDKKDENAHIYIDLDWSGTSSAVEGIQAHKNLKRQTIAEDTVDNILLTKYSDKQNLVFKIDVEGYEPYVLSGMKQSITNMQRAIGYIELDSNFLKKTNTSLEAFNIIVEDFDIYLPMSRTEKVIKKINALEDIKFTHGEDFHTDIILVKAADLSWLPHTWKISS